MDSGDTDDMGKARKKPTRKAVSAPSLPLDFWRRLYAAFALAGMLASTSAGIRRSRINKAARAKAAYEWADEMLKAGQVH